MPLLPGTFCICKALFSSCVGTLFWTCNRGQHWQRPRIQSPLPSLKPWLGQQYFAHFPRILFPLAHALVWCCCWIGLLWYLLFSKYIFFSIKIILLAMWCLRFKHFFLNNIPRSPMMDLGHKSWTKKNQKKTQSIVVLTNICIGGS